MTRTPRNRQTGAHPPPAPPRPAQDRHRAAAPHRPAARAALALRRTTRPRPGRPARTPRPASPRKAAHALRLTPIVVPTFQPKLLKTLMRTCATAEVGLARR